jgi:hypothetical protein
VGENFTEDVAVQDAHGWALKSVYRAGAANAPVAVAMRPDFQFEGNSE